MVAVDCQFDRERGLKTPTSREDIPPAPLPFPKAAQVVRMSEEAGGAPLSPEIVAGVMPREMLHEDEVVLILTKPSLWFVVITSFRFVLTVMLVGVLAVKLVGASSLGISPHAIATVTALVALGRLIWGLLVWSSHTYMLTNLRVVTIKGVVNTSMYQANLRKLQRTVLWRPWYFRVFGVGTVGFATAATTGFDSTWVMLGRPLAIHEAIVAAVNKAQ
ncbi:MAG: PH domain-containing protein [Phycisphaerales bacterium]|nr:PH domain-containing protein [Phycisphaerales bacterium]